MKTIITTLLALLLCTTATAQKADVLYQEGKALYDAKDYSKAFPKLKAAAEKGHKKAQYRLGRCYDKGRGTAESNEQAFQWYSKSADQGYGKAQLQLGKCYLKGKGVAANQEKARQWLSRAVKNPKSGKELLDKLRKGAEQGDEGDKKILKLIGK